MYCFGSTAHGQLGLGGIEAEQVLMCIYNSDTIPKKSFDKFQILSPKEMNWSCSDEIELISCGNLHTLFVTQNGKVFSCGNNDYGQLGHDLSRKRPRMYTTCTFSM